MKKILAMILAAALLLPCLAFADTASIDAEVDGIFRTMKTVGGALVVAKDGEIVYERYYGVQHKGKQAVTEKTYFRCASVSKWVAGIGLLKLMEDGILDPEEDISTYLGYKAGNPRYPDTPITLRMLMSHTSGINENASYNRVGSLLQDMLDVTRKAKANFNEVKPGTKYVYSNFGAGTAGSVAEAATGKDFSLLMREILFEPLGIDAAYTVTQLEEPEYIAATYDAEGKLLASASAQLKKGYETGPSPDTHYRLLPGGLRIRARDLCRLGIALCGDGTVDGVRVLNEETLKMVRTPNSPETTGITEKSPYSFFSIHQDTLFEGRTVYGHQGTSEGVVCNLYYEPESQIVLCLMTNGCQTSRDNGVMRITRRMAAIVEREWMDAE